jgi:Response regulator receiver domain
MDVKMPDVTGLEVASQLTRELPGVVVILMSAFEDEGIQKASQESGAFAFVMKEHLTRRNSLGCPLGLGCGATNESPGTTSEERLGAEAPVRCRYYTSEPAIPCVVTRDGPELYTRRERSSNFIDLVSRH